MTVFNKCDKLPYADSLEADKEEFEVLISAKTGEGLDEMLSTVAIALPDSCVRCRLILPFDKAGLLNTIRIDGKVFSEEYTAEGIEVDALIDKKIFYMVEEYKTNSVNNL